MASRLATIQRRRTGSVLRVDEVTVLDGYVKTETANFALRLSRNSVYSFVRSLVVFSVSPAAIGRCRHRRQRQAAVVITAAVAIPSGI